MLEHNKFGIVYNLRDTKKVYYLAQFLEFPFWVKKDKKWFKSAVCYLRPIFIML